MRDTLGFGYNTSDLMRLRGGGRRAFPTLHAINEAVRAKKIRRIWSKRYGRYYFPAQEVADYLESLQEAV